MAKAFIYKAGNTVTIGPHTPKGRARLLAAKMRKMSLGWFPGSPKVHIRTHIGNDFHFGFSGDQRKAIIPERRKKNKQKLACHWNN